MSSSQPINPYVGTPPPAMSDKVLAANSWLRVMDAAARNNPQPGLESKEIQHGETTKAP